MNNWDASKQILFDWVNSCPKGWVPHWYESESGNVTLHIIREEKIKKAPEDVQELLRKARGR